MTESPRNHDTVDLVERAQVAGLQRFGGDPLDVDAEVVVNPGMPQRFGHADIRVGGGQVFSDDTDPDAGGGMLDPLNQLRPIAEIGG